MTVKSIRPNFKIADTGEPVERGYKGWKANKIEKGISESKDHSKMIPADKVWRELGLEC